MPMPGVLIFLQPIAGLVRDFRGLYTSETFPNSSLSEAKSATAEKHDTGKQKGLLLTIKRVVPIIKSIHLEETRKFYTEFLGFDLVMDMGWIITFASPSNPTAQISFTREKKV